MDTDLARRLIGSLNSQNIEYCHWKSNLSLANALAGEEDLDILVDRKTLSKIIKILTDLGFKAAIPRSGSTVPGIFHYYGFDPKNGKICHVHLFNSVLTGESFVKSHSLPIERMLLENGDYIDEVRVVSKSAELVLFILRTFIKYGSLLDLFRLAGNLKAVRTELRWLREGADISKSVTLLKKYCPVIDEALFLECIETLEGSSSLVKHMVVARKVRRQLQVYAKYTPVQRFFAYAQFLWIGLWQRLTGNRKNKTLHSGGAIVAIVGADATGKSTLVAEAGRWLGSFVAVRTVHVGKPPVTWLTTPVNGLLPVMRLLLPQLRQSRISRKALSAEPALPLQAEQSSCSLLYAARAVALAWDRYQLLIKVRRWAANGEIVICDRYPTDTLQAMDSPRLRDYPEQNGVKATLYNRLVRLENRFYVRMPPPDCVLRLSVSVETAKQRNWNRRATGMDAEDYLEARHRQIQEWNKHGTKYSYDIGTERSLEETILSVKNAIWEAL